MREIPEPELTHIIQAMDRMGEDPITQIEIVDGTAYWRNGYEPQTIDRRDREVLDMNVDEWEFAQVVLSRMVGRHNGYERETLKSRHLPIKEVKQHLRGNGERDY